MTDTHPEAPWLPEGRHPTLEEWLTRFDTLPPDDRLTKLRPLFLAAQLGDLCQQADHASYPHQLDHLLGNLADALRRGDRYRAAWASARRRAQQHPPTRADHTTDDLDSYPRLLASARHHHRDVTPSWPCHVHRPLVHTDGPCPQTPHTTP